MYSKPCVISNILFYKIAFFFFFFLAMLCGLRNLSSWARNQTQTVAVKVTNLNHCTTREFHPKCVEFHLDSFFILTFDDAFFSKLPYMHMDVHFSR